MIDIIQFERDIAAWVAGVLGRTVNTDVFRGGFPESKDTGVCVLLRGELKDGTITGDTYNVQALGKFLTRDEALVMNKKLSGAVPCFGVTVNNTEFMSITPRGGGEPYTAADNGVIKTYASVNLIVSARPAPLTNP